MPPCFEGPCSAPPAGHAVGIFRSQAAWAGGHCPIFRIRKCPGSRGEDNENSHRKSAEHSDRAEPSGGPAPPGHWAGLSAQPGNSGKSQRPCGRTAPQLTAPALLAPCAEGALRGARPAQVSLPCRACLLAWGYLGSLTASLRSVPVLVFCEAGHAVLPAS